MHNLFVEYLLLVLVILALIMVANKLKLAYPIVLVMGGLALSLTTTFSNIVIDPDFVFFIFLPPLLYEAAWQVSWKEFWKWRRAILSFAFPIVILTSCVVALVSHWVIPGFTLALGFLLGGIVSPPDAVSSSAIMKRLTVPRGLISIGEGESLLNDAASLIVFRFALMAVVTGMFDFKMALGSFFMVVVMGTLIGLLVGLVYYAIHRWLPTTPSIQIVLSLVTPYLMYYAAESFHFSGVLAVVSGGLFLSSQRRLLLSPEGRVQGGSVWTNLVFVLNGLVFMLIGLQLPSIVTQLGDIRLSMAIRYGLIISGVLIITRILCTLGASVFTRMMSHVITVADANPGWKLPLIHGWAGMRGVVSLAAALSIPLTIAGERIFPFRNLILFITFIVILVTLVLQGLTLPWLIRKLKVEDKHRTISAEDQENIIQCKLAQYALEYVDQHFADNETAAEFVRVLQKRLHADMAMANFSRDGIQKGEGGTLPGFRSITLAVLDHQRDILQKINQNDEFDENLIRKYQMLIDIEELKVRQKYEGA